jgi:hypothetical protein
LPLISCLSHSGYANGGGSRRQACCGGGWDLRHRPRHRPAPRKGKSLLSALCSPLSALRSLISALCSLLSDLSNPDNAFSTSVSTLRLCAGELCRYHCWSLAGAWRSRSGGDESVKRRG